MTLRDQLRNLLEDKIGGDKGCINHRIDWKSDEH